MSSSSNTTARSVTGAFTLLHNGENIGNRHAVDESIRRECLFCAFDGMRALKAMYEARLEDVQTGDLVVVECVCGRAERLTAQMLKAAGVKEHERIVDLSPKLRCRECDERGKVLVSIRWATVGK